MTLDCLFCEEKFTVDEGQMTLNEAGDYSVDLVCTATDIRFNASWKPLEPEAAP